MLSLRDTKAGRCRPTAEGPGGRGPSAAVTRPRRLDAHVRRVRVRIGPDLSVISTVRGVGYRLTTGAPVRVVTTGGPSGHGAGR
jgi:hypothetical protein